MFQQLKELKQNFMVNIQKVLNLIINKITLKNGMAENYDNNIRACQRIQNIFITAMTLPDAQQIKSYQQQDHLNVGECFWKSIKLQMSVDKDILTRKFYPIFFKRDVIFMSYFLFPSFLNKLQIYYMYKLIFVLAFLINRASSWCLESYSINTGQDVFQMDISPNQQYIVAGLQTKIQIYNYATRAAGCSYSHGGVVRSLKFHPSSTKFALGIETDTLRIVTVTTTATCSLSKSLATGHAKVLGIDFNSDGSKMVTCGDDKKFRVWNMTPSTPTVIGGGFDLGEVALSCKFSHDEYVAVGIIGNVVKRYSPSTYASSTLLSYTFNIPGHADRISFFNCDKDKIIMGSDNGGFYAWNSLDYYLHTGTSHVKLAIVDPSDDFIAIGKQNYELNLIQSNDFTKFQRLNMASKVFCGDFLDNGQILAVGLENHYINFLRRCGCSTDSAIYNQTYCPIKSGPNRLCQPYVPPPVDNSTNTTDNSTNTTDNSTNTTDNSTNTTDNSTNTTDNSTNTTDNSTNTTDNSTNMTDNFTTDNSTDNSTNTTDNSTNITDNSTNATNISNMSSLLDSYTVQQFFTYFLRSNMVAGLTPRNDLQVQTQPGIQCNSLVTRISLADFPCSDYLRWSSYIRIIHPHLTQTNIFCKQGQTHKLIIQSMINKDIKDPEDVYITLPKSSYINSGSMPPLRNWSTFLSRVSAGYSSLYQPALYSQAQCSRSQTIKTYLVTAFALSCVIMIVGVITAKIVGLEMFGILQIAYFNLANHGSINIHLYPLTQFNMVNGPNFKLQQQITYYLPNSISSLSLNSEFMNNFNVMGLASIALVALLFTTYLISSRIGNQFVKKLSVRILKQSSVTLAMFNAINIGFSAGVHCKYSSFQVSNPVFHFFSNLFLFLIAAAILVLLILFEILQQKSYGEFKRKFKFSWVNKSYISLSVIYRIFTGFYLAYESQKWETTLYIVGISMFFLLYFIVNLPFRHALHNYRAGIIHLSFLIILLVSNYYRSMKMNTQMSIKSKLHNAAILQLVVIGASLFMSIIGVCYEIYSIVSELVYKNKKRKVSHVEVNKTFEDLCTEEVEGK